MYPGKRSYSSKAQTAGWILLVVLASVIPGLGQVEIGDYTKMNLSGYLGFGYNAGWGTFGGSRHSTSFIGDAHLAGHYYSPNFLSFDVRPHYNRTQANSASQSTVSTSGFDSLVSLFTGSHFPGSVGFSKQFNDAGEVGIPGVGFLSTDGSAQNFNITWSELLPNWPTLTANFSVYSNSSTVVGANSDSTFSGRNFNLNSTYSVAGFNLAGFYNRQNLSLDLPDFLTSISNGNDSSSSSLGVSANHRLPLSGSLGVSWTRSTYNTEQDVRGGNTFDNTNVIVTLAPARKLTVSSSVNYVSNLSGVLQQRLVDGGVFEPLVVDTSSRSVSLNTQAFYTLGHGFGLNGYLNHRDQFFRGDHLSDTQYGGVVTYRYARPLLGMLYLNFGMFNNANQEGNQSLSFSGNVGFTKKFGRWDTNADFSYAQNVQTLVAAYTTSNIGYGGFVRRRINLDMAWTATFRAAHSALTQHADDSNRSETVTTGFTWRNYTVTGNYSQSEGASVLSASGTLVPTPIGGVITPDVLLFNGRSYGASLAATPIKRLTVSGYYTNVRSDTLSNALFSFNRGQRYSTLVEYKLRKLEFRGGFTRTQQDVSAAGTLPAVVNSYFFSISRWFNIF